MKILTLDKSHIDQVEHSIAPPMRNAVTIPCSNGVVVYVCTSPFGEDATASDVLEVARGLAVLAEEGA